VVLAGGVPVEALIELRDETRERGVGLFHRGNAVGRTRRAGGFAHVSHRRSMRPLAWGLPTEISSQPNTSGDPPIHLSDLTEFFGLPFSTIATNVKKLEKTGLIRTDVIPNTQGSKKICSGVYSGVYFDFSEEKTIRERADTVSLPIGYFSDCYVEPSCGLVSYEKIIGEFDHPASFYDPDRVNAQLVWFRNGYIEYKFPNNIADFSQVQHIDFSLELCSEAPLYRLDWPSDITFWINGVEIGTWTSPSDFGGVRGILTPHWWGEHNTQYGVYKTWLVTDNASYIDGKKISDQTLKDVIKTDSPCFTVRIGIKKDAVNDGGVNIFGEKFGNYETNLLFRVIYKDKEHSV
jgi:predicted transcriptional regulator